MNREEIRARIAEIGIIPAVRLYSAADALFAAEAICEAGIPIVEVTMTVPGCGGGDS
jgi:2-dehydro-3-deoxyphosphogluconate aldolase / (4S)-4-hydroxy-2-oxoglutarate aldolase